MQEYKVTAENNFMRIFRLPKRFPEEFCFNGGHPTSFQLVDWFNPVEQEKLWSERVVILSGNELDRHREMIREFIRGKLYFQPQATYLALADYGDAFLINPPRSA